MDFTEINVDDAISIVNHLAGVMPGISSDFGTIVNSLKSILNTFHIDPTPVAAYHQNIGNIPVGALLKFELGNVDDSATVTFEGLSMTKDIKENGATKAKTYPVGVKGENAVVLTTVNSGGHEWCVNLDVSVNGGGPPIISIADGGNDNLWFGRVRIYLFQFNAV